MSFFHLIRICSFDFLFLCINIEASCNILINVSEMSFLFLRTRKQTYYETIYNYFFSKFSKKIQKRKLKCLSKRQNQKRKHIKQRKTLVI